MIKSYFLALCVSVIGFSAFSQPGLWTDVAEPQGANRQIEPLQSRTVSVDFEQLKSFLLQAPHVRDVQVNSSSFTVDLPTPDGGLQRFRVVESPVLADELQENYPELRTFAGQGTGNNRHATLRMDFTLRGFHAQVLIPGGSYYIDPFSTDHTDIYMVYTRKSFYQQTSKVMPECSPEVIDGIDTPTPGGQQVEENQFNDTPEIPALRTTNGTDLRTYRLALACTGEYADFHGGTVPLVMSAFVTSMNRVNGVFERDMSLRMVMVTNNDNLIFLDGGSDPYSNGNGGAMLGQNQTTCDNIIGFSNYDIGHVFSTGGGGVAFLQSPCGGNKAGGVTGQSSPVGDPFDIDYVAHEMGHQWGGNHTQNNSCNRSSGAAFEPGSASTIMGYAGICPPNLQNNSDDHFHNHSFNEMYNFSVNGFGNSCAEISPTDNNPPSVTVPAGGFFIPVETPFELSATATDPDDDLLTYCWEQYDLGPSTSSGDNDLTNPSGNAPIFRSWSPTTDGSRVFPRLSDLVNNTTTIGEHLPTYSRDLTFRCTVRDNRAGGGGVTDDEVAFEATINAGPFLVTAPNSPTTWSGGTFTTVTWDVANTNLSPVNCGSVDVFLSLDGGFTYPQILASNVPNNGSINVVVPNISTTQARVKVKAANNIFFDISDQDFNIVPGVIFDYDVAMIGIDEPTGDVCNTLLEPVVTIQNLGSVTLTSLQIDYNLNGNPDETYIWTGTLTSNSTTQVTLPAITASAGGQSLNVTLSSPNGQADENGVNNSGTQAFNVIQLMGESLPVSNDFEAGFPGTGWTIENPDGDLTWTQTSVLNDVNCNSGNAAFIDFFAYNAAGETDDLVTPTIDLSGTNAPEVTFDYSYARYNNTYFDRMQVQILVGCDENWTTLWDKENLDLANAGSITTSFSPDCGDWSPETIDLSAYIGEIVQIRFRGITGWGNNLYLDNINVFDNAPICSGTPSISNISPTTYNCSGGQIMTINGSNFCDPVSVSIDGNNATINSSTETQIDAVVPTGSGSVDVVVTTAFGSSSAVQMDYAAPVIASVAPTTLNCAGGAALTIIGSNFCDATNVTVGGNAASITTSSATQIVATAPAGSGLNVAVQVTTPSGTSNTVSVDYAAPVIASVAPTTLDCAGGASLTITGSNFCNASSVTVGGNSGTNLTQISSTQIVFTAPAGSGLNVPVQVTTPSGTSNTVSVDYAAPVIASLAPTTLDCAGGATLTITGSNFCNATSVTVGGAAASITTSSATQIVATAPAGSGLNVPVQVTTPSGTSNTQTVNYAVPVIASVAPTTLNCAGGASLTITGSNFCDATSVTVGGNAASITTSSATQIVATAPAGSGTNVPVQVTTPSGASNTQSVDYGAPLIISVAPTTLNCAGGAALTITGSNFCDATSVTVGGNAASITTSSATQIVATAPAGSGTNVPVQVTTPSGSSNTAQIDYAAPVIASVAPTTLDCAGGAALTITGSNFCDATSVTVGGNAASITTSSANQIVATAPPGSGTNVAVQVTTPSGTSNTVSVDYAPCDPGCVAGEFNDNGTCTICPAGFYCPGDGNSYPCAAGEFSSTTGAVSCEPCLAGFYNPNTGATSCQPCESGSYSDITGATECIDCPAGTSQGSQGQTSCEACPVGTYSSVTGAVSCTDCPAGTANNQLGQTECTECPAGSFSAIEGSAECSLCPSDTYSDVSGSVECINCPAGSSSDPGSVSCVSCNFDVVSSFEPAIAGFANGSATVVASGGQEPYSYQWNDPFMQTTATAVGLFPGTYSCTVTDANNCEQVVLVDIGVMSPYSSELNEAYCNTSGYILSDFISANPVTNATAYRWEFTPQGGSALPAYTRYAANQWVRLQWVSGIALGTTYDVRVKVQLNGQWGEYGDVCTITTSSDVPLTEVLPNYTPTNVDGAGYALCDFATAYNIANATNFRWRFDPDQDPGNGNEIYYTRGTGNPSIRLSWANGLQPGATYYVAVQASVSDTWGSYGNVHPLNLAPVSDQVTLRSGYCNESYGPTEYLLATNICDATYYRFRFIPQVSGAIRQKTVSNYALGLGTINPPLAPGTYNVQVQVNQNGVLGNYGPSCPITISGPTMPGSEDGSIRSAENDGTASIFPNPNRGDEVSIEIPDLSEEQHEILITVFNVQGQRIDEHSLVQKGSSVSTLIRFDRNLPVGLYTLQIVVDGQQHAVERLVVN